MSTRTSNTLIGRLQQIALLPGGGSLSDGQLLERFCAQHDGIAFEALVRRHGPMVFAVCQRVCRQQQDAEDAFQASFLVLARKAPSVRPAEAVGNWLYGVAYRTALRARATAARRLAREKQVKNVPHPSIEPSPAATDLESLLDQELSRLADKYRLPLVLCELEGRSRRDVARQLKLPEGTLSSRLATARKLLAARLTRRGVTLASGALACSLAADLASACPPSHLIAKTAQAANLIAASQAGTNALISTQVMSLMEGTLKTMLLSKLKLGVAILALVSIVCASGYSLSAAHAGVSPATPVKRERRPRNSPQTRASAEPKTNENISNEIAKPARLRGRFTDADTGKPVAGAILRVMLRGLPRSQRIVEAISDTNGQYELPLPYGDANFWGVIGPAGYYTQDPKTYGSLSTSPNQPLIVRDLALQKGSCWHAKVIGADPDKVKKFEFTILPDHPEGAPMLSASIINASSDDDGNAHLSLPYSNEIRKVHCFSFSNSSFSPIYGIPDAIVQFEGEFDPTSIKGDLEILNDGKAIGLRDTKNRSAIVKGVDVKVQGGRATLVFQASPPANAAQLELHGSIQDEMGKPVQGAKLSPLFTQNARGSWSSLLETVTDVEGEFVFRNIAIAGELFEQDIMISLTVVKSGHDAAESKKVLLSELKGPLKADLGKLVMKVGHPLSGKVVDEKGNPLQGALITNVSNYMLYSHLQCRTDASGNFVIPDLSFGAQKIRAEFGELAGEANFQFTAENGRCTITVKRVQ